MANEFEWHIAMNPEERGQPDNPGVVDEAKGKAIETVRAAHNAVRANAVTVTSTALVVGPVGVAIGWMLGQSSARSARYWPY